MSEIEEAWEKYSARVGLKACTARERAISRIAFRNGWEANEATQQSEQKTCFTCGGPVNTSTGYVICERGCGGPVTASR